MDGYKERFRQSNRSVKTNRTVTKEDSKKITVPPAYLLPGKDGYQVHKL